MFKSLQTQGLQVECAELLRSAQPHTVSPSTRPCSSSEELRASVQLVPQISTTDRPLDRPVSETRDMSNRRLPLERLTAPAPRAFPARSPDLRRVDTTRSLRSPRSNDWGDGRFTTSEPLRRISSNTLSTLWSVPRRGRHRPRSQAWAFSSHGARCDRASDIPVASSSYSPCASLAFAGAACWPYVLLLVGSYGSQGAEPAETTVDAFP